VRARGIVAAAAGPAFVLMARRAAQCKVSRGEERAFRAVNGLSPKLRAPVWVVMQAGSLVAVPVAAAVALPRSRAAAIALAVDGTAVWALCKIVKRIVKRGRPSDCLPGVIVFGGAQRGRGFPSGHAAVATTITVIGARLLPKPASQIVWAIPVLVGGARQYVGAHLPLDVIGGFALGVSAGALANVTLDR
jgi:membrane-associated phospholipid phosphatase